MLYYLFNRRYTSAVKLNRFCVKRTSTQLTSLAVTFQGAIYELHYINLKFEQGGVIEPTSYKA